MALGTTIGVAQALSEYRAMNSKLIGEAWSNLLSVIKGNSNILSVLVGPPGSKKPLTTRDDLTAGRKDRVNMNVAASLGMHPRQGSEQLVGYNETPRHGNWTIRVDQFRIAVGWSEFVRSMANTGKSFKETYAELLGERFGQIEQNFALHRFQKDATPRVTLYPGGATSVATLRASHTLDVDTIKRGAAKLSTQGCTPAMIGKTGTGRPINKFVFFGADGAVRGIKDEIGYSATAIATLNAEGEKGSVLEGDFLPVDGQMIMPWYVVDHDNPGPIGAPIFPKALLGDASATHGGGVAGATAAGTTTFDIYGGGITQTELGDQADLYKPFVDFPGFPFKHYQEESPSADSNVYGIVIFDPDDGKWNYYEYVGSDNDGKMIKISYRLGPTSDSSARFTRIRDDGLSGSGTVLWTYDTAYNKDVFGPGAIIIPVNTHLVPYGDVLGWGADAGGYAYGEFKNQRIVDGGDFGDRTAFGIKSIFGTGVRLDTQSRPRGFVRIRCAVQHEGINLPVLG